ncbi:MFS transporter [Rhodoplanes sp. Z2-YC6860]|uniref:MFS transporter n=1 Tax=Rhodoplanes sp. Z2-YC6860 TaxID=674703 RepID=UPI00078ECFCB|nr:MFS transporter [Rhodoplanes sp. Z2-YC6860]AMN40299.1 major facilitator family protein [Rhodoplanes sp. Z2-YC6860]
MAISTLLNSRLSLPLRNANYGIYAAGNAVSLVGTWMQRISIGWLTWELTHSGFWLGIMAFADFVPVLLIGPIAGAVADRRDRLRLIKRNQVLSLLQATTLCVITATGHMNIGVLVLLTALQGMLVAYNQPARLALVPSLVAETDLASAVAINSVIFNLARFVGPMLAGLIMVTAGIAASFAANALSYIVFLAALTRVHVEFDRAKSDRRKSLQADLREGIRYTTAHPAIASVLVLLIAIGIGGRPLNELLPGFAAQVFHSGAGGLSILASATGAGAIVGGLWLGHRVHGTVLASVALRCSLGGALAAIAVCFSETMWFAVPAVAAFGFCVSSAGIAIQTIVQLSSDKDMRGRVMGLYGVIFRGAPAIGALAAGTASSFFGLRWPIAAGAAIVIAAWFWARCHRHQIETALPQLDFGPATKANVTVR